MLCKACIESGEKHKNLEITDDVEENSSVNQEELECDYHPNSKGNFYCDDCRVFLCKICFANDHRSHNSNLPSDIAMNFKQSIQNLVQTISQYEPKIDESIKIINDLENKIRNIRESSYKKLDDIVSNINKLFVSKNKIFLDEYANNLESTDDDISDVNQRLKALQGRMAKFLVEISEIKSNLAKNYPTAMGTCIYKQSLKKFFLESQKIFNESKFLLGSKVDFTVKKANEKILEFKEISQKLYKKIKVFRSSVINSIQTGISSFSLRVRRFTKFSKTGIKYYKTSSLKFKTNSPVSIVGFAICGLYVDDNMKKGLNCNNYNSENRANSVNLPNGKEGHEKIQSLPKSLIKSKTINKSIDISSRFLFY